jgi:thiol-disulfide isomerase/thioredoxin
MSDASSQNNERPKPHNALRISIISAVILFLLPPAQAASARAVKRGEPAVRSISLDKPFPDLQFKAVDGNDISISQFKGKYVLIDFWAVWCGPCISEMPALVKLYEEYHDKGFEIVGISLDSDIEALKKYLATNKIRWPQYFDGKTWDNEISKRFGIHSIPSTVLLDKSGYVIDKDLSGVMLRKKVERLLSLNVKNVKQTPSTEAASSEKDLTKLAIEARDINEEEVEKLEERLNLDPNNLSIRARLLGYYSSSGFQSERGKSSYKKHVLWVIENKPDSQLARRPFLEPTLVYAWYPEVKELWLKQVGRDPNNAGTIGNAARFFFLGEPNVAIELFEKAQLLDTRNYEYPMMLGMLYQTEGKPQKSLEQIERSLSLEPNETEKFVIITSLAKIAYEAGDRGKAEKYAKEALLMAPKFPKNWNYGNAIHNANAALGRIALAKGDIEAAKNYLIEAGKTPGSPSLNSYGPNMTLAKELLEKNERQIVLDYFELCGKFWKLHDEKLKKWSQLVKDGQIPDFGANLLY